MISIYKITNKRNGKPYVGQTNQPIEKRFLQHSKADSPLGQAMRASDNLEDDFTIEVIETCETVDQAKQRERFWIRVLKCKVPNGYNRSDGGESSYPRKPKPQNTLSNSMEIHEALKRFRQSTKLSQRQLAEKIGVPYQSYQTYEYGNSTPGAKVIVKIADAFDVSADYLLGRSDEPHPKSADALLVNAIINCRDSIQQVLEEVDRIKSA